LLVAVGILLCRASLYHKLLAIGMGLSLLGILAVFWPYLMYALLSNAAALAAFIVIVTWLLFWHKARHSQPVPPPVLSSPPDDSVPPAPLL